MTSKLTYWGVIGLAATSVVAASPAYAAGTAAGASITNTATVDYQVGGVSQGQQTASNTFVVDRVVNLTVIDLDGATVRANGPLPAPEPELLRRQLDANGYADLDVRLELFLELHLVALVPDDARKHPAHRALSHGGKPRSS